jgi:hypothetical protein
MTGFDRVWRENIMTILATEQRLSRLEDIQAIGVAKARYLRACDRKQPDLVRACFTDNAIIDFEGFPQFSNPDDFVAIFTEWGCRPNIVDMHHMQNPIIELIGPETAKGWFDLFFFQIDTDTGLHTQLAVNYDDDFQRIDGEWRISRSLSRRRLTVTVWSAWSLLDDPTGLARQPQRERHNRRAARQSLTPIAWRPAT